MYSVTLNVAHTNTTHTRRAFRFLRAALNVEMLALPVRHAVVPVTMPSSFCLCAGGAGRGGTKKLRQICNPEIC